MFNDKEKKSFAKFKQMLAQKHDTALTNLLQNKDFRFYMAELLGVCKTFENAFDEKGNVAAFNNGKQSIGQKIFNDIMLISPQAYITMCEEEQELLSMRNQMEDK
jgi:hypothetical protein